MTETEIAGAVPTWSMPLGWQTACLYVFGVAALASVVVAVWLAMKRKSWLPLAYFLSAALTINLEPLIARVSSASHAQIGQITAFVSEGRAIPVHVALVYTAYFGFGYYFLIPAFESHKFTSRSLRISFFVLVAIAWLFEAPFIAAGMWDYFGYQSLKPFGLMPIYFAFVNVASSFIGCALLAVTMPLFSGMSRLWVILLAPAFTIGAHFGVAWPMYNLRTSVMPAVGSHVGALLTVILCLLSTELIVRTFARDRLYEPSRPLGAAARHTMQDGRT